MIRGIGVDMMSIDRISQWLQRYDSETLGLVFTPREIESCYRGVHPAQDFAICFAGKEAVSKALGTGVAGFGWNDIEIDLEGKERRLSVGLHGAARGIALACGISSWSVTSSRLGRQMLVCVVAAGGGGAE